MKSDRLVLVIDDRDERLELPETGAKLEVSIGYRESVLARMGSYVVDGIEVGGPVRLLSINATAADMTGKIKAPKERSFHQITLLDLAKTIAADNGLTAAVAPRLAGIMLPHVDQTESDMQLLTRICADHDAVCKVADGRLVVADHAKGETTGGAGGQPKALPVVSLSAGSCGRWRATIADRGRFSSVVAYWQDKGKAERTEERVGAGEPSMTLKQTYPDQESAKAAATSKYKALSRATGTVSIVGIEGDTALAAERELLLSGFRAGIDGAGWIITSVTHRISSSGYTCDIEAERK
ncbi:MAG: late control protein D [Sphingomonas sp.]|uniref:phage late control D family protein n=1 Tax=Sphingomonas sp. TaxID=28214 RepID=UPI002590B43E|nr:contractile injection system protein, VgrG/Pvc8 family [Sphingomonas sp.]MCP4029336.1 late control protein D [Sphingomonas sp.]